MLIIFEFEDVTNSRRFAAVAMNDLDTYIYFCCFEIEIDDNYSVWSAGSDDELSPEQEIFKSVKESWWQPKEVGTSYVRSYVNAMLSWVRRWHCTARVVIHIVTDDEIKEQDRTKPNFLLITRTRTRFNECFKPTHYQLSLKREEKPTLPSKETFRNQIMRKALQLAVGMWYT